MTLIITVTGISESPAPAPASRLQTPEPPSDTGPGPGLQDSEGFLQGGAQPLTRRGLQLSSNPLSLDGCDRPTGAEAPEPRSHSPVGQGATRLLVQLPALEEQRGPQQLGKVPGPAPRGLDSELGVGRHVPSELFRSPQVEPLLGAG